MAKIQSNNRFGLNGCYGLTSVTIPNSVMSIGQYSFSGCWDLASIAIPNSVTSIGDQAFIECGLTSVTIPNSVTSIGNEAFYSCPLTSVTIPNSVKNIGEKAFYGCHLLTEVRSIIKKPFVINSSVFQDWDSKTEQTVFTSATLYVPAGTKAKYEATEGWKIFSNIVEMDGPAAIEGDLNGDDEVDVTDVVELIDMVLAGIYDKAGDINEDGEVDVTDVVELIDMVLSGE